MNVKLDRRIVVERKATPDDPDYVAPNTAYGTENVVWLPQLRRRNNPSLGLVEWAEVQDALPSRSESVLQGLVVARNQTRIRMRWREGIDSSMRIVDMSTLDVYQIIGGPAMLGRRQFLEVQTERIGVLSVALLQMEGGEVLLTEDGKVLLDESGKVLVAEGGEVFLTEEGAGLLL